MPQISRPLGGFLWPGKKKTKNVNLEHSIVSSKAGSKQRGWESDVPLRTVVPPCDITNREG